MAETTLRVASFAYWNDVTGYDSGDDNISIDLLSTPIETLDLENKKNLRRVRATYCKDLSRATFTNCPNLEAVELLGDVDLRVVRFVGCPNLRALDISASRVTSLSGIESLEYLSAAGVRPFALPPMPRLRFLEFGSMQREFPFDVHAFPQLEAVRLTLPAVVTLSSISSHPSLRSFSFSAGRFVYDSLCPSTHLQFIALIDIARAEGDPSVLGDIYLALDANGSNKVPFDPAKQTGYNYVAASRLLFGPWGVPRVDQLPTQTIAPAIRPPAAIDAGRAVDGILGSIFGGAIGDWIGVGTEFIDGSYAKVLLPEPIGVTWSHEHIWGHNQRFLRGTPTDDTSQAILILRSLIASNTTQKAADHVSVFRHASGIRVDVSDFARRLVKWMDEGHAEHKHPGGLGCGATTYKTMMNPRFRTDPIRAAREVWVASGKKVAPNGSVMRISTSGCFAFWDESLVLFVADLYGRATHADPRCVFCAQSAALIISRLLQERCGLIEKFDLDGTLQEVLARVEGAAEHRDVITTNITAKTLQELELSGNRAIGYCLKCLGSAVWALRYAKSFEDGIAAVVREAGDADTNGSVVGAFLGAKFGFGAIDKQFIEHMFVGQWLWREVTPYFELMGLSAPASPYLAST